MKKHVSRLVAFFASTFIVQINLLRQFAFVSFLVIFFDNNTEMFFIINGTYNIDRRFKK